MEVSTPAGLRVALVHHWLVAWRGGERVLEALADLFPAADLFTLVCDESKIPLALRTRKIHRSLLQRLPGCERWYRYYLPLFPFATEHMDLRGYDLIISSDAATVKGVRIDPAATHICYCHSPMRYVWNDYDSYYERLAPAARWSLRVMRSRLCRWDYEAAQRVNHFVANSRNVQQRIRDFYRRESIVIYPPVDTDRFRIAPDAGPDGDFFLLVSYLVPYKKVDVVVDAFNRCGRPLVVIGDGPERQKLELRARPNIRFLGLQPEEIVLDAMQRCRAFVFAGEEDFGIVMAEAQACGKPVIALGRGGASEIVEPGVTGVLFETPSAECLIDALDRFEGVSFEAEEVRLSALRFGRERFLRQFSNLASEVIGGNRGLTPISPRVALTSY